MSSYFFPEHVPPVVSHAIARVERQLPQPGELLVRVGSRVEPDDIIARTTIDREPQVINVGNALGIAPREISAAMRKKEGDRISVGEVIARLGFVGGRKCLSPVDGTISLIDPVSGCIVITPDPEPFELRAQVRGIVMEIPGNRSISIETPAASIYGIAGVGDDRFGVLRLLVTDPTEILDEPRKIDATSAYAIIIAGAGITAEALHQAIQQQVRGVVVGGIETHELMAFLGDAADTVWQVGRASWRFPALDPRFDPGLTLVLTEGFGVRPMSHPVFELLAAHDRQEALIQGATSVRSPLMRPRLVIPLTRSRATADTEPPHPELAPGTPVRLVDDGHLGLVGTIVALPVNPEPLPSGTRGLVAHVQLSDGARVVVARSAVEALAQ